MKRLLFTLIFLLSFFFLKAQPYGNEWINYSGKYYVFKVASEGIYRISYSTLKNSGIPVDSLDPRNFQIFARGVEIPLYLEGENDGVFGSADFMEFYAEGNDGFLDAQVYDTPESQSNPYYSLFNDTAAYYITWNSSTTNKRMKLETSINFGSYTKATYFLKELVNIDKGSYHRGKTIGKNTDAEFVDSEGWFSSEFNFNGSMSRPFVTTNLVTSGPDALFKTIFVGESNNTPNPDHRILLEHTNIGGSFVQLLDTVFEGYKQIRFEKNIPASSLNSTQTDFKYSSVSHQGISENRTAIAYSYLKFAHNMNLENETSYKLMVPDDSQGKAYLELTSFSATGTARLYDISNGKRITVVGSGGLFRTLVPNTGAEKKCYLTSEGKIKSISNVLPVSATATFTNFNTQEGGFLIITNKKLLDGAGAYADYRTSKGFDVLLVDIDELYHQFAYGIEKHPLAIRNFCDMSLNAWSKKPEFLFLIGKAYYIENYRSPYYFSSTLVPTFGAPPSDALLTAGLNGSLYEPAIPTGRLAAKSNADVLNYLNKIIEYETEIIPAPEWKKEILHFGGGTNSTEQETMLGYLDSYKAIIQDTLFGGHVSTFLKSSTNPVQITLSDSIKKLMDAGTSLLTFFAHASATTFDISLEDPANYANKGRYPLVLANACLSGDIFTDGSTSEDYVLIPDKGVIGFMASIGAGYPPYLDLFSKEFYKNLAYKNYGQSIGLTIKETVKAIQSATSPYLKDVCLQTVLHGDPALKFNSQPKPDIMVSQPNVFYSPGSITTDLDSFTVNVIVTNLGKSARDSFNVLVSRILPDGSSDTSFAWVHGLIYKDTVSLGFKINSIQEAGLNQFNIYADYSGRIEEMTESNNSVTVFQNIKTNDIIPVYPYQFAVVPDQNVVLKASTGDPFAPARNYIFEVDTTDLFNSLIKEQSMINSSGGIVTWQPDLLKTMPDSVVYFWRVSPEPVNGTEQVWRESSFQYIQNKRGWGQAHFFQYKNDKYDLVLYDKIKRKFQFESAVKELSCLTMGEDVWSAASDVDGTIGYKLDAGYQEAYGCYYPSLVVAVIDSITLKPWGSRWQDPNTGIVYNPDNHFGNFNDLGACRNRVEKYFLFGHGPAYSNMADMIKNKIPKGNYLIVYSYRVSNCQYWDFYDPQLHNTLEALGATGLRTLQTNVPFIFMVKVGYPETAVQTNGVTGSDIITAQTTINNNYPNGDITTELIGPSKYWRSLHWRKASLENPSYDNVNVNLSGVKSDGTMDFIATFPIDSTDILNLYDYVDAKEYPYLKLEAELRDDSSQTSPQMKRWQVLFDDVPEAALNASVAYEYYSEKVAEGDSISLKVAVSNISDLDMDSIHVKYWLEDQARNIVPLYSGKKDSLQANKTIITDLKFSSKNHPGNNKFWIEINSKDTLWQLEKYHFNNLAQLELNIERDKINPLLDVTFDGVHILDGDIVSAKPLIQIKLADENKFIALNDTVNFAVFLKDPKGNLNRIHFIENTAEVMRFTPAILPKNSCSIEYSAAFALDGTYELRVQAKDASDNSSGSYDYVINFEVINKSTITEVINYPNPFSSSTRFVFTLTGSEIPSNFKIQILTVTGKVVKEITQEELGVIRIGRNITEYAWDGKDEFGDPLANGVYLYRVITKINDKDIEHRETSADQYFHNDFGKMYLMR